MNRFKKLYVKQMLNNVAEEQYGEFGYDTLKTSEKIEVLKRLREDLWVDAEFNYDNDRLLQYIDNNKEIKIIDELLNELL